MKGVWILLLLLTACTTQRTLQETATIQEEISHLASLSAKEKLTVNDLQKLKALLADDAEHELEEIELMIEFGEYEHAGHALGFLADYVASGKHVLCPAHGVAHYYVFMRHGAAESAEHALEHTDEELDLWTKRAKEYNQRYPTGQDIDALRQRIEQHLANIAAGQHEATDEEIRFLATTASICVPR